MASVEYINEDNSQTKKASSYSFASRVVMGFLLLILVLPLLAYAANEYVNNTQVLNPLESAQYRAENFLNSLIGAIIGVVVFFILAPYLLFKSEFQYTVQHFAAAVAADINAAANGYVNLYGKPELKGQNTCSMMPKTQCLYYAYKKEKLTIKEKVVCGDEADEENVQKISPAPDRCRTEIVREGGQDVRKQICEKCWNAKVKEWEVVEQKTSTPEFKIGVNTITPNKDAKYEGDFETMENSFSKAGVDYRESVKYISAANEEMLAVGTAKNGIIATGDPFVISTKNFEATKQIVAEQQKTWEWIFRIGGFLAFLIGMYMILAPIPALIDIAGAIPFIGGIFSGLASISSTLNLLLSIVVAVVMTLVLIVLFKILRILTDNIFVVIGITIVLGIIVMYVISTFGGKPAA